MKDCEWIAQLLQHGLLRGSFVPDRPLRELRDLTRHRAQLISERGRIANRMHKVLEDANIKLAAVASDILGVSGREMIQAMIVGQDGPEQMAQLARRRLRKKIPQLRLALEGKVTEHHRFMLKTLWDHLGYLESLVEQLDRRIEVLMRPFQEAARRLRTIPGVDQRVSEVMIAELGADMGVFPSAAHLSSWAGLCPGNNESAGKRKSGRTTKASRWLRRSLSQAAWAAGRTKDTYLSAHYHRLARRRGRERAIIGVAHTILVIVYYALGDQTTYTELGGDYLDRMGSQRLKHNLVQRLRNMGYKVTIQEQSDAA